MSDWAAKVLEGVPRHNAQDAKSMTGYAAAVWLHEDAVVDAIARMEDRVAEALREAAEMIDKRHRGDLPDHIKSEDGNAIRAMIKEAAPRRYMGQIMAECDCPRRQECEAAQKCLSEAARSLHDAINVNAEDGEAAIRAKTCPPCHGDCNQGRTCPARKK